MFNFLSQKFTAAFSLLSRKKMVTAYEVEQCIQQVYEGLLQADVPLELVESFTGSLKNDLIGTQRTVGLTSSEQVARTVHKKLIKFLGGNNNVMWPSQYPAIVMVMGLQGAGKTTTVGKLAHYLKIKRKSVMVASLDFRRPAAILQLERLAQKVGVSFYRSPSHDVCQAAIDAQLQAKKQKFDVLILDTAGRLHVDQELLEELLTVTAHVQLTSRILVIDGMTGQESLRVARTFQEKIGFDAGIITKLDGDARAGSAFAFYGALAKPVLFVGEGEHMDNLVPFNPERIAGRLLGFGDIHTLAEEAEKKIGRQEQEKMMKSVVSGDFTLRDFANQIESIGKLGSLSKVVSYLPGVNQQMTPDIMNKAESELKQFRAIISSMRKWEQDNPSKLNSKRKYKIVYGAGVKPSEVDLLIDRFQQAKQYAKMLKKVGLFKNIFG